MNRAKDIPFTRYVLGLLFREDGSEVVLIRKNKPAWQAGLLNGVGGKIEPGEIACQAMVREFKEETGAATLSTEWKLFCELNGDGFSVLCFKARSNAAFIAATSQENEPERVERVTSIAIMFKHYRCVSNLPWLVALALDENDGQDFYVTANYRKFNYAH